MMGDPSTIKFDVAVATFLAYDLSTLLLYP